MSKQDRIRSGTSRRKYLVGAGAGLVTALAGCSGGDGGDGGGGTTSSGGSGGTSMSDGSSGTTTGGSGGSSGPYKFGMTSVFKSAGGIMFYKAGQWYADKHSNVSLDVAKTYSVSDLVSTLKTMLNQDYDALLIESLSPSATAKVADEADIPVFGYDVPTYSKDILLHTSIDNKEYGAQAGRQLVNQLESQKPNKSQYKVVELLMDQNNSNAVQRHKGMNEAWDDAGNVDVVKRIEIAGYSSVKFQKKMNSYLQTNPQFDGICAPLVNGVVGALNALDQHDMKVERGKKGHKVVTSCDAGPPMPSYIGKGYADAAAYQPAQYYVPITLHYATQYLDNGNDPSVFPETGTKLTADDLPIMKGETVEGYSVWESQSWSPADVLEFETLDGDNLGYPWIKTTIPVMDKNNYDDPTIYANLYKNLDL